MTEKPHLLRAITQILIFSILILISNYHFNIYTSRGDGDKDSKKYLTDVESAKKPDENVDLIKLIEKLKEIWNSSSKHLKLINSLIPISGIFYFINNRRKFIINLRRYKRRIREQYKYINLPFTNREEEIFIKDSDYP